MARYLYSELASLVQARTNAIAAHNTDWASKHHDTILDLVKNCLPHGSGIDCGVKIEFELSHANKLVFSFGFHHMNENGFYDGWTEHTLTVTPSLASKFDLRISGRNRNDIKEYLYDLFSDALSQDCRYYLWREQFPQYQLQTKWENEDGSSSQCYVAHYVGEKRFWNDFRGAVAYAGERMEDAFYGRG